MLDYIIIKKDGEDWSEAVKSSDITGLLIASLPPITRPAMRNQQEVIDGRDGDIVTELGYSAYDKPLGIAMYGNYDYQEILDYFSPKGQVIFSNEPDKYYEYQILDFIQLDRVIKFKKGTVTFHVQPFKYPVEEEQISLLASSKTVSGGIANFTAHQTVALDKLEVDLEPIQDLNGYDHPWAGGAGKNLLPYPYYAGTETKSGVTFTDLGDGTVEVNGTNTSSSTVEHILRAQGEAIKLPAGSYKISGCTGGSTSTYLLQWNPTGSGTFVVNQTNGDASLTLTEDTYIRIGIKVLSGATVNNVIFKPMIRLASETDATWQPYENICPISGHTAVKVYRTGKNLIPYPYYNTTKSQNGVTFTDNSDGSITANGTATADATFYFRYRNDESFLLPVGSYKIINGTGNAGSSSTYFLRVNVTRNGSNAIIGSSFSDSGLFTVAESDTSMGIYLAVKSGTTVSNLTFKPIVVVSEDDDTYEVYDGETTTISLGRTVYGGTLDVVSGLLTVDRKLITVSDYTWAIATSSSKTYARLSLSDRMATPTAGMTDYPLIASMLLYGGVTSGVATWESGHMYQNTANKNIFIYDSAVTTLEDFEAKYADMQIAYYLATPLTYQLTATEVETLLGENNIWADSGDVEVVYTDAIIITNEGNTASRPIIRITGTGTVDLEINDDSVLTLTMGSTATEFVVDAEALEVYSGTTLKNRQALGDYDKIVLQSGENTVSVDGDVTKATIEKYTRWI